MAAKRPTYKVTQAQLDQLYSLAFMIQAEAEHLRIIDNQLPASDLAMETLGDKSIAEDQFLMSFGASLYAWVKQVKNN